MIRKIWVFLKCDLLEASSYKFSFIFSILGIIFSSATFFFISKLVPRSSTSVLSQYGGDYFSFVIIGVAFSGLLGIFQEGLPGVIRNAQVSGTLEALLVTQTGMPTILIGSSLYSILFTTLRTVIHIVIAVALFGMRLGEINVPGAVSIFVLTAVCFVSIGILSSSFTLVYKMGNPLSWIFSSLSGLLGGMFFPVAVLPPWIKWCSYFLPVTYSLEGMRRSLLSSSPFSEILPHVLSLAAFSAVLLPASLLLFRLALRKAKKDGSLTHY